MGTVNPRPRGDTSLGRVLREDRRDREQFRRVKAEPDPQPVLVQISDEENLSWPVGTAWLDTSGEV